MKNIYVVQEIKNYGKWGETNWGDVIGFFHTEKEAEEYCEQNNIISYIRDLYPSIGIRKIEMAEKTFSLLKNYFLCEK